MEIRRRRFPALGRDGAPESLSVRAGSRLLGSAPLTPRKAGSGDLGEEAGRVVGDRGSEAA